MRFQQFVERAVNPVAHRHHAQIGDLAVHIDGGWEVWMQVEIYLILRNLNGGLRNFRREAHYPDSTKRSDFSFVPANADSTTTWVELKVEKRGDVPDALNRFGADIAKLGEISLPQNDTAGAVVCIATDVQAGLEHARRLFDSIRSNVRYYLIANDSIKGFYHLGERTEADPGDFAVLYYIRE